MPTALPARRSFRASSRMALAHRPVMREECLAGLGIRSGGCYVDGTFGRGGHSAAILDTLAGSGALHALDRDPAAAAAAWTQFAGTPNFRFHRANFAELARVAADAGIAGRIDGILLDLGVSSPQLDEAARGFSFAHDGPLDMRMDPDSGESAAAWLARVDEAAIADVLWTYGEERNSRRIARRIIEARAEAPLRTTAHLAALVASVPGPRSVGIHPATRSFQAIRIHINGELQALETALAAAPALLAPGGRLAVISFHSLEDRIVKRFLRENARSGTATNKYATFSKAGQTDADDASPDDAGSQSTKPLKTVGRYFPTAAETAANPRARSAVLRVAEKCGGAAA